MNISSVVLKISLIIVWEYITLCYIFVYTGVLWYSGSKNKLIETAREYTEP
jgi:hypothetical protein